MIRLLMLLATVASIACNSNQPPSSPSPGPGPNSETITGRERIGWDQSAGNANELATLRYAIYVDGARSVIAEVSCAASPGTAGFACSGRLPSMSPGQHTLEIAAFTESGGVIEGPKSAPLRVTVTGSTAPAVSATLQSGDAVTTVDGVRLIVERLVEDLDEPTDLAVTPDGRVFVAERAGSIHMLADGRLVEALAPATDEYTGLLGLTVAPDFARSGHVVAAHSVTTADGEQVRAVRYRMWGDRLIERMVLLPDVPAPASASAVVRFGPDGRLYAGFESTDREVAARLSDWRGKILRLEADGRTPDDQPAASPVFWSGLHSPRGFDWNPDRSLLWIAERGDDGRERLRGIAVSGDRPRRAGQRAWYVLPEAEGLSSVAFHDGAGIPEFGGDLFAAMREQGYLLRVRFQPDDPTRAIGSERLLDDRIGQVRAVATGRDGALYIATNDSLWRLISARPPDPGAR